MKRFLSIILVLVFLLPCLCGCFDSKSYAVSVEENSFLCEPLNKRYAAGERVVIKTNILLDTDLHVYLDGEDLGGAEVIRSGDSYSHWEYYFTMPSRDVKITFSAGEGMVVAPTDIGTQVVWVNYGGSNDFYAGALNSDTFSVNSVTHLPIYKFETPAELEEFTEKYEDEFSFDYGGYGDPSFYDVIAGADEAFFEENTLFVVYITASSGSYLFGMKDLEISGESLCITAGQTNNPEMVTCDMAGWFVVHSEPKERVKDCKVYDAIRVD